MHLFLVPLLALHALAPVDAVEPSEGAMRIAFETRVTQAVAGALDFVAETTGETGVETIRAARTDHFDILGFRKETCEKADDAGGYRCTFRVEIATVAGEFHETLNGRFYPDADGFAFADEI